MTALLLVLTAPELAAAVPRKVLILHSFGRDFGPYHVFSSEFRTALVRGSPEPIEFHEATLETVLFQGGEGEDPAGQYVRSLHAARPFDLLVAVGAPAVRLVRQDRDRLLPGVPALFAAVDRRFLAGAPLSRSDAAVASVIDLPQMVQALLQVLPDTREVFFVIGSSPLERFWLAEAQRELQRFSQRLTFIWAGDLSFDEIRQRAATLGPQSAILYTLLVVDRDGVPYEQERALARLAAVASAPIFGLFEHQLGQGTVGGPLLSVEEISRQTARAAARLLQGEAPSGVQVPPIAAGPPIFDWRELQRWGIQEDDLPPGSEVRFRQQTFWSQYRWQIVAVAALVTGEAALIVFLTVNYVTRRRKEEAARGLSRKLIQAQEQERARVARDLHDDVTQRLARLAIDAAQVEQAVPETGPRDTVRGLREGLVRLSEDVHGLSYQLHPSIVEDLGLPEALRVECERFSRPRPVPAELTLRDLPEAVPQAIAFCLYRVAQEALRNVARHAGPCRVQLSLAGVDGGLQLVVRDEGAGFDPAPQARQPTLGLASMRERVSLLGGELDLESRPGAGTTVLAWVPLTGGRS
ncbi:MAG: histidine kinase [Gammaproteobacteria bacterium]|nr:histidine kinase [Gammaproteobacteria bacterium]